MKETKPATPARLLGCLLQFRVIHFRENLAPFAIGETTLLAGPIEDVPGLVELEVAVPRSAPALR